MDSGYRVTCSIAAPNNDSGDGRSVGPCDALHGDRSGSGPVATTRDHGLGTVEVGDGNHVLRVYGGAGGNTLRSKEQKRNRHQRRCDA